MFDGRHNFLTLVHHSVCLYNFFNIIFFNHTNGSQTSLLDRLCRVFMCLHQSPLDQVSMYTSNILENIVSC